MAKDTIKLVAQNKKAHFEYFLEELFEAGLSLSGTEVKSLRLGKCSLKESFVRIEKGEAFLYNMHISPYEQGNIFNKDPLRTRKMLLHKSEIRRLIGKVKTDGYTIVIQHTDGYVSIFHQLGEKLCNIGSEVKVGEAIAFAGSKNNKKQDSLIQYELWLNGLCINPEDYIVF